MTKPVGKPQHLYQSQHAYDLANRATLLTGGVSGVLVRSVLQDVGYSRFSNQRLGKTWGTLLGVRYVTCFYAGLLDVLVQHGAPLHLDQRERLDYIRADLAGDDTKPRRTLRRHYAEGAQWATDYMDEMKENQS